MTTSEEFILEKKMIQINNHTLYESNYEDIMPLLADNSIDMVLADLPYGTTKCKWDTPIGLNEMWGHFNRIVKPDGAILLFAQTPFDKILGASNLPMLRYEWIWEKTQATGGMNSKKMPMKAHENILVFYKKSPTYNPQKTSGHVRKVSSAKNRAACIDRRNQKDDYLYNKEYADKVSDYDSTERYPRDVLRFKTDKQKLALHETQKPVALLEYFIRTYTNEGDTVLDITCGSGGVGVASGNANRKSIQIDNRESCIKDSVDRLNNKYKELINL